MLFCKYKDIFGRPGEGAHEARIGPTAAVDVILTVIFIIVLVLVYELPVIQTAVAVWMISEVFHYLFCIDTTFWRAVKNID